MKKSEQRLLLLLGILVIGYVAMTFMGKSTDTPTIIITQNEDKAEADPRAIISSINQQVPEILMDPIETSPAWGHDIFGDSKPKLAAGSTNTNKVEKFKLTGIMYSQNQTKAIINDKVYYEGMLLDGFLIIAIENESVLISEGKGILTIKMGK
jgi:hypothetical protein